MSSTHPTDSASPDAALLPALGPGEDEGGVRILAQHSLSRSQLSSLKERIEASLDTEDEELAAAADTLIDELRDTVHNTADRLRTILEKEGALKSVEALQAAIMRVNLEKVFQVLDEAGLDDARDRWFLDLGTVLDDAEERLAMVGVTEAKGLFDKPAMRAVMNAHLDVHEESFWKHHVRSQVANNLWKGLRQSVGVETLDEVVDRMVAVGQLREDHAVSEARRQRAEYARVIHQEAAIAAAPEGTGMRAICLGPQDNKTRAHCAALDGLAFTPAQLAKLRNQHGRPTQYDGGGFRCRHRWVWVVDDDAVLAAFGVRRATDADVERANRAHSHGAKKGKGKGRGKGPSVTRASAGEAPVTVFAGQPAGPDSARLDHYLSESHP